MRHEYQDFLLTTCTWKLQSSLLALSLLVLLLWLIFLVFLPYTEGRRLFHTKRVYKQILEINYPWKCKYVMEQICVLLMVFLLLLLLLIIMRWLCSSFIDLSCVRVIIWSVASFGNVGAKSGSGRSGSSGSSCSRSASYRRVRTGFRLFCADFWLSDRSARTCALHLTARSCIVTVMFWFNGQQEKNCVPKTCS